MHPGRGIPPRTWGTGSLAKLGSEIVHFGEECAVRWMLVDGDWYLLGYRSCPNDDQNGKDYVDVFGVRFDPLHHLIQARSGPHLVFIWQYLVRKQWNPLCGEIGQASYLVVLQVGAESRSSGARFCLPSRRVAVVVA